MYGHYTPHSHEWYRPFLHVNLGHEQQSSQNHFWYDDRVCSDVWARSPVHCLPTSRVKSSDTIFGQGATLIFKPVKMKFFRVSQSSVVHIEAVLMSNQFPVWPAKIFQRFIDTVICKLYLSQSFRQQSTSCAKNHTRAVLCSYISIVSFRTILWDVAT